MSAMTHCKDCPHPQGCSHFGQGFRACDMGLKAAPPPASPVVDERAPFEQWAKERQLEISDRLGEAYYWPEANRAWQAWQASAAVRRTTGKDQ